MHGQLEYLQIPALDITASARFYEQVFGWRVAPPEPGFEAPGLIGQWVTDRAPSAEAGPLAWIHVTDAAGALRAAASAGGGRLDGPTEDGPRLLASFTDPAGNLVGVVEHCDIRTMPEATIIPELVYDDVPEAAGWLCRVFGFTERWHAGDHRAQLSFGNGTIAITEPRTSRALAGPRSMVVRVDDARGHCERVRAAGARIVAEPQDFHYGERQYTAEDLGGHHWTFSQTVADVAPEEWGGTPGRPHG